MHNRLIFLYHRVRAHSKSEATEGCLRTNSARALAESEGGTQEGRSTGRWLSRGKQVGGPIGKSVGRNAEMRCRAVSGEVTDPTLPRKASSELTWCPYPKPTQVGT